MFLLSEKFPKCRYLNLESEYIHVFQKLTCENLISNNCVCFVLDSCFILTRRFPLFCCCETLGDNHNPTHGIFNADQITKVKSMFNRMCSREMGLSISPDTHLRTLRDHMQSLHFCFLLNVFSVSLLYLHVMSVLKYTMAVEKKAMQCLRSYILLCILLFISNAKYYYFFKCCVCVSVCVVVFFFFF